MSTVEKLSPRSAFPLLAAFILLFYSGQFYLDARSSILASGSGLDRKGPDEGGANPFVGSYPGVEQAFMPLIGFTAPRSGESDFFGLGAENYYFQDCAECVDVFVTGHAAGFYAEGREPLARLLERTLKEKSGKRWRVWDLTQDHSTLAYQTLQYLHLGLSARPEFVITNGLALELRDSLKSPPPFQRLGLALAPWEFRWATAIHSGDFSFVPDEENTPSPTALAAGALKALRKYTDLAVGNGATFLISLPPNEADLLSGPDSDVLFPAYSTLVAELEESSILIDRRSEQRPSQAEIAERYASVLIDKLGAAAVPARPRAPVERKVPELVLCDSCELMSSTGKVFPIEEENFRGELESVTRGSSSLIVKGWAQNVVSEAPAGSILVFIGPKFFAEIKPTLSRIIPGKAEPIAGVGFEAELRLETALRELDEVRVFARTEAYGFKELKKGS